MSFDHGTMNLPLGSRTRGGSIDRQIDAWKREQAAEEKAKRKAHAAERKERQAAAKALLSEWEDRIIAKYGARFGVVKLRKKLRSDAHYNPDWLVKFVEGFKAENF